MVIPQGNKQARRSVALVVLLLLLAPSVPAWGAGSVDPAGAAPPGPGVVASIWSFWSGLWDSASRWWRPRPSGDSDGREFDPTHEDGEFPDSGDGHQPLPQGGPPMNQCPGDHGPGLDPTGCP